MSNEYQKPDHYQTKVDPWELQRHMQSSGNAFVDARRADAIKYAFRKKENMLQDLKKARHCLDAAIERLEFGDNLKPCDVVSGQGANLTVSCPT